MTIKHAVNITDHKTKVNMYMPADRKEYIFV